MPSGAFRAVVVLIRYRKALVTFGAHPARWRPLRPTKPPAGMRPAAAIVAREGSLGSHGCRWSRCGRPPRPPGCGRRASRLRPRAGAAPLHRSAVVRPLREHVRRPAASRGTWHARTVGEKCAECTKRACGAMTRTAIVSRNRSARLGVRQSTSSSSTSCDGRTACGAPSHAGATACARNELQCRRRSSLLEHRRTHTGWGAKVVVTAKALTTGIRSSTATTDSSDGIHSAVSSAGRYRTCKHRSVDRGRRGAGQPGRRRLAAAWGAPPGRTVKVTMRSPGTRGLRRKTVRVSSLPGARVRASAMPGSAALPVGRSPASRAKKPRASAGHPGSRPPRALPPPEPFAGCTAGREAPRARTYTWRRGAA